MAIISLNVSGDSFTAADGGAQSLEATKCGMHLAALSLPPGMIGQQHGTLQVSSVACLIVAGVRISSECVNVLAWW